MRCLADLALLLGQYEFAVQMYRLAAQDYLAAPNSRVVCRCRGEPGGSSATVGNVCRAVQNKVTSVVTAGILRTTTDLQV